MLKKSGIERPKMVVTDGTNGRTYRVSQVLFHTFKKNRTYTHMWTRTTRRFRKWRTSGPERFVLPENGVLLAQNDTSFQKMAYLWPRTTPRFRTWRTSGPERFVLPENGELMAQNDASFHNMAYF